ncbi:MAG TPA: GMC oxidoreductase [Puia sp.]|nr:GMC oxidoreductase [Puia sp.]
MALAEGWSHDVAEYSIGKEFKEALTEPGTWSVGMGAFGETLPYHENKVTLDRNTKDKWGLNVLSFDCELKENELKMRKDMLNDAKEMLEAVGAKNVQGGDSNPYLGRGIHEMGTARMGKDRKTSVLNKWNQVWNAPNVFVTDGAFMVSAACQNPSLTYMAFTARAADHAVSELKKNNI